MGQLEGKVVWVTGASRGMGENHARRLVEEGARVLLTDLAEEEGREVARGLGEAALFVRQDVAQPADWDAAIVRLRGGFGRLDGLVNNAALLRQARLEDEDPAGFQQLLQVNVVGTWWGLRKTAPLLREAGGGSVVNVSSTAGLRAYPGLSSYATTKWAVRGLTKVAAQELGRDGIRVNSIHPGGIEETGMFRGVDAGPEVLRRQLEATPLGRFGKRDDVSNLVIFLLSDASSYLSGAELAIDGGSVV